MKHPLLKTEAWSLPASTSLYSVPYHCHVSELSLFANKLMLALPGGLCDMFCVVRICINCSGLPIPLRPPTMSSRRTDPSSRSSPGIHHSVFNADPSAVPYPIVPKVFRDGTVGSGRPCEICQKVIRLGANGSLHPYNLHIESCQRKQYKPTSGSSEQAMLLSVIPSTAASSSRRHRSPSLSPLLIQRPLHPSLSPTPSPTNSPTYPLTSSFFDARLDVNTHLSASIQSISAANSIGTNPAISINPPSDGLPSPSILLYSPQPHEVEPVPCSGVLVKWTPGTIWETYPFPSHTYADHPWDIIDFRSSGHLCLHSKDCARVVDLSGHGSVCSLCLWIPQCKAFKAIESRANYAPPHTPYHLLGFHQLSGIPVLLRKKLNEACLKVIKMTGMSSRHTYNFYRMQHYPASSPPNNIL